jgi:predicted small secreted protein
MITTFKRVVVLLCVATVLAIVGMGCNTAHGFGKDVSAAGQGIQNGTK